MKSEENFVPSMEDLWVMFLRDADAGVFSADSSDVLNYLMDKAIEERRQSGEKRIHALA